MSDMKGFRSPRPAGRASFSSGTYDEYNTLLDRHTFDCSRDVLSRPPEDSLKHVQYFSSQLLIRSLHTHLWRQIVCKTLLIFNDLPSPSFLHSDANQLRPPVVECCVLPLNGFPGNRGKLQGMQHDYHVTVT